MRVTLKHTCTWTYTYIMYVHVAFIDQLVSTHTVRPSSSRTGTCCTFPLNITRTKHLTGNVHALAMIPFMCNYHGLLCFFITQTQCVLIQIVARAHSCVMTLTLPSGTRSLSHVSQSYTRDTTGRWKAHCRSVPLICSVVPPRWIHTATMFRVCVPSATAVCIHLEGGMSQGPH